MRTIAVAVGILVNAEGLLLMCRRPEHKSYPLQWEFPGGKVEAGEHPTDALRRELQEELGIDAEVGRMLHEEATFYQDDDRTYSVAFYAVTDWDGTPFNTEFAEIRWVSPTSLLEYDILKGNVQICTLISSGTVVPGAPN